MNLLNKSAAAERLDISVRTLDRLVSDGKIRYVLVRSSIKFTEEELCRYIKEAMCGGCESKSMASATSSRLARAQPVSRPNHLKQRLGKILSAAS